MSIEAPLEAIRRSYRLIRRRLREGLAPAPRPGNVPAHCGWSVELENARPAAKDGVRVRRYPFPYKCALAVSNDTDGLFHDAFEAFHGYVSGRGDTRFGPGLGLEVADSFWIWAKGRHLSLYHALPWDDAARPSPEHDRLLELARAGWIDTLHGFGAWNENRPLERDRIARALDYLDSKGVKLKVYVGHGGTNMAHNFGGPWGYYQHADDPGHVTYCLDLLKQYGFLYFWADNFYELDKFGEDLVFEDQSQLDAAVLEHDFHRYFHTNDPGDFSKSREVFPDSDEAFRAGWRQRVFNRLLFPVPGRDGQLVYGFKRFRGHDGPMSGNFIVQVNPQNLDALEARQGAVVVYQHFGVWRALFMGKRHASQRSSTPESVLDEHNIWAFRTLAQRHQDGRIFVTTTRRLLDFVRVRNGLDFSVERVPGRCAVTIDSVNCPVAGKLPADEGMLQGIALEIPREFGAPQVFLGGRELAAEVIRPDGDSPTVVHFPWRRLDFPS